MLSVLETETRPRDTRPESLERGLGGVADVKLSKDGDEAVQFG